MSVCDPAALTNLYDWLESIPFSRPKRSFSRDFSDGILVAELIKYFFPTLVDLHNYPASNSFHQKKVNWSVLNHKVLKKLDFPLSDITINHLASGAKRDATEYFLYTLRGKIDFYMKRMIEKMKKRKDSSQDICKGNVDNGFKDSFGVTKDCTMHENYAEQIGDSSLLANGYSESAKKTKTISYLSDSNLDSVPREVYDQKVQELLACEETIQILKARIQRLENMLQLKNVTIDRQQQTMEKLKSAQNISTDKLHENKIPLKKSK